MRRALTPLLALAASAVLLIGCASAAPQASPSPTAASSSTPSPTPVTEVDPELIVSLEGITTRDESGEQTAAFADPSAVLALLEAVTGELPEPVDVEIFEGQPTTLQRFEWDGLRVLADSTGESPASLAVTAPSVNGVAISTDEGLTVGSLRTQLLDAGAWALLDTEDPATAPHVGLGSREVPGTQSLTRPGNVGVEYLMFTLDGDTVTQIDAPANDFSDI